MHLLDTISVQQFPSSNHIYTARAQTKLNNKFVLGNYDKRWAFRRWNSLQIPKMDKNSKFGAIELNKHRVVVIRAVVTLEPKCSAAQMNGEHNSNLELGVKSGSATVGGLVEHGDSGDGEESEELDEKEKLRRMRISKANKGNTPWNKGRKHNAETLRRIRERTRIAMQSPKVKMKLVNLGHAQSKETRVKIGVGVRAGWERRRERLKLQETCYFEWQNLIAEASRRGSTSERELQWDSYRMLNKELEREWLESVEKRKNTPRPKGNKRAPKSLEQRRKISEAISAKWADAGYRGRVCSALSKYYGTPVGVGRKPRRTTGERKTKVRTTTKKKAKDTTEEVNTSKKVPTKRRNNMPTYEDPLVSSKLEMIKNIRTQRAAAELRKTQAFKKAKLLIWEAEKAAKALEASAMRSPLARASLLESRELIAQAIQSLNMIEKGHLDEFNDNDINPLMDVEGNANGAFQTDHGGGVNGFGKSNFLRLISSNRKDETSAATAAVLDLASKFSVNGLPCDAEEDEEEENISNSNMELGLLSPPEVEIEEEEEYATTFTGQQLIDQLVWLNGKRNRNELLHNGIQVCSSGEEEEERKPNPPYSKTSTKKWVRGRLVETVEGRD